MYKLFIPDEYIAHYNKVLSAPVEIKQNLHVRAVPNGIVAVDIKNETFGVCDANGKFIPESAHRRNNTYRKRAVPHCNPDKVRHIDADAVYCDGGWWVRHFGHLLCEGLNRTYPILDKKYRNCKYVFVLPGNDEIPSYSMEILNLLGIPRENIICAHDSISFNTLYVPTQATDLCAYSSREMADICRTIADNVPDDGEHYDKIYVSRLAMGARKTFGEERIQKIFENNGYHVIYPEQLSVARQISLMQHCKYLAGSAGTALHLALFMRPGGTVIQLKRNTYVGDSVAVQNLINQTVGLDFVLIWTSVESTPTDHFTDCPQIIGATKYFTDFLKWAKFKFSYQDLFVDARTVHEYNVMLSAYNKTHSKTFARRVKKLIARLCSCWVPGRSRRKSAREFFEKILKYNN